MIDPTHITNFNLDDCGLEEHILFWICAAGKNGITAAICLDKLLSKWGFNDSSPFDIIKSIMLQANLAIEMKTCGIGCYNNKSNTFSALVTSNINLRFCRVEELETIKGIGPKTARCFLLHTRPNQRYAGLDTHILKFLSDQGHKVPKSTPTGKKYAELETLFLQYVDKSGLTPSDFDLMIWNRYREKSRYDGNKIRAIRTQASVAS